MASSNRLAFEHLREALDLCEHPKARFHVRQAMQFLADDLPDASPFE